MALQPHFETQSTLMSRRNHDKFNPSSGAFFANASGFVINGGKFTNNVYNSSSPQERHAAFRTILLGDIKLAKEIRMDGHSGVVSRQRVRQTYSAEIRGDPGPVTVAIYQGDGAEAEWRQHIARYELLRHPNIMQIYGLVSTSGLYAIVFHHELIPFRQFFFHYHRSPISLTYIVGYHSEEWHDALDYFNSTFPTHTLAPDEWSAWIDPTTGELCVDFTQKQETDIEFPWWEESIKPRVENVSLDDPSAEAVIILNLNVNQYHQLCCWRPQADFRRFEASAEHLIGPAIFWSDSQHGICLRITEPLDLPNEQELRWGGYGTVEGVVLSNSWIRYDSPRALCLEISVWLLCSPELQKVWLAQANHIFSQFQSMPHLEDYVLPDMASFILRCSPNTSDTQQPKGYLFVCPPEDFRAGASSFQWPTCPAYWSLEPSGAARLSPEEAKTLGFATIHIETAMQGRCWHRSVYDGLRQFHRGKGFDPDSQDVAKHLGHPLFELAKDADIPVDE
ncbi:hypothetical protein C8R45DRAFT_1023831 [Mycena sanguinolenta]|nr:hypothetical protein C8R45DRAFT_1023831 [Mycena sanguinolenta]